MKVRSIMTTTRAFCNRETDLADAVEALWNY